MSEPLLKTRNVFVDTEAYVHQKFRFDHPALTKLRTLGNAGFLHVLATESVVGEVRRKMGEQLNGAFQALGRFQKDAGMLEATPSEDLRPLFKRIEQPALLKLGTEAWEKFLSDTKVEVATASNVQATDLLQMYFARKPPFSAAKKAEFPDAISLLSLEQWHQSTGSQLYMVSGDPDLKAWCADKAGMHHIESLKEFLDLYNRAEEKLTQLALAIFEREEEWIVSAVEESFGECNFVYADNWEADVENISITSTRVDDVDLIEVDEHRFILALEMEIQFHADVSGPDYDHGWWDSEDKKYIHLPSFHTEVESTDTYDVSFEVIYDITNEKATEIKDVMFDDGTQITVRDDHGPPYK